MNNRNKMDGMTTLIGLIISLGMFIIPIISWLDTLFSIPLTFIYPSLYIYFIK